MWHDLHCYYMRYGLSNHYLFAIYDINTFTGLLNLASLKIVDCIITILNCYICNACSILYNVDAEKVAVVVA